MIDQSRRWMRAQRQRLKRRSFAASTDAVDANQLAPVSRVFGLDRGQAIDRFYIEGFLSAHAADIAGAVLEIGDREYTRAFGRDRVTSSDVLHLDRNAPGATITADLAAGDQIPASRFDCVICTQTLQFIYDVRRAIATLHHALKPGGRLLVTVPGISQISRFDMDRWGEYWRFTSLSSRRLLEEVFPSGEITVETYGNAMVASSFLQGFAAEEIKPDQLAERDPDYELLLAIRAVK